MSGQKALHLVIMWLRGMPDVRHDKRDDRDDRDASDKRQRIVLHGETMFEINSLCVSLPYTSKAHKINVRGAKGY